jgi:putative restriction endonuclease
MTEDSGGYGDADADRAVRIAAFAFLADLKRKHGETVPRTALAEGFNYAGRRVPVVGPQGIFKPAVLAVPLSITTVPVVPGRARPYEDEIGPDETLTYRYRGTNPDHPDNQGLRTAMVRQSPLIYLYGITPGRYLPVWPVFVVGEDRAGHAFRVAVDTAETAIDLDPNRPATVSEIRRRYVTAQVHVRVHQVAFRERVLAAYREQCAVCRLRHVELLDAAHILPDGHPLGEPTVPNGLALCKLHHAAFDRHILGVRPDLVVEIREDILREEDGPMLRHGLQGFQGVRIRVPRPDDLRPSTKFLAERYELFRKAG